MKERNISHLIFSPGTPLRRAMSVLYRRNVSICLVCNRNKKLLGVLTLSDVKQALLKGVDQKTPIRALMNAQFISASDRALVKDLAKLARRKTRYGTGHINKIPLLNDKGRITGLYTASGAKLPLRKTVLVTGGAGYVGAHVCRRLLTRGYKVVVLDKLIFGDRGIRNLYKHPRFTLIAGDIGDIGMLIRATANADAVIHLAGIVGDPASSLDALKTMEKNHFATKALLDVAKYYHVPRFIFASSCSVYGASTSRLNERSETRPMSLYAQSKLYSERELEREADDSFTPIILRFGTLYGLSPRMRFDLVVNAMTANAYFNKRIMVDGGAQWRPLLHVDDAAAACVRALEAELPEGRSHVYNVGSDADNYRISEIAERVRRAVRGSEVQLSDTVRDPRNYRVIFRNIRRELGFTPAHTLAQGVAEILRVLAGGMFKDWKSPAYNNFLTEHGVFTENV